MASKRIKYILNLPAFLLLYFLSAVINLKLISQPATDTAVLRNYDRIPDSLFVKKYHHLLHLETWWSVRNLQYDFQYKNQYKLKLKANDVYSLSFGVSYRFVSLGIAFSPAFLDWNGDEKTKGETERFGISAGFSFGRLYASAEYSKVQGFYLENTKDFRVNSDSPYVLLPHLVVNNAGILVRYNLNSKFSTAGISGGMQKQLRSALTVLPAFYASYFRFKSGDTIQQRLGVHYVNDFDLNLVLPVLGTLVIARNGYITGGAGPSIGLDFYKSISYLDASQKIQSEGTNVSTGYYLKAAAGFNRERFFAGTDFELKSYGKAENNKEGIGKKFYYIKIYAGWRIGAPGWGKKTLDWINKKSPVKLE
jgi:hypothetical protein